MKALFFQEKLFMTLMSKPLQRATEFLVIAPSSLHSEGLDPGE